MTQAPPAPNRNDIYGEDEPAVKGPTPAQLAAQEVLQMAERQFGIGSPEARFASASLRAYLEGLPRQGSKGEIDMLRAEGAFTRWVEGAGRHMEEMRELENRRMFRQEWAAISRGVQSDPTIPQADRILTASELQRMGGEAEEQFVEYARMRQRMIYKGAEPTGLRDTATMMDWLESAHPRLLGLARPDLAEGNPSEALLFEVIRRTALERGLGLKREHDARQEFEASWAQHMGQMRSLLADPGLNPGVQAALLDAYQNATAQRERQVDLYLTRDVPAGIVPEQRINQFFSDSYTSSLAGTPYAGLGGPNALAIPKAIAQQVEAERRQAEEARRQAKEAPVRAQARQTFLENLQGAPGMALAPRSRLEQLYDEAVRANPEGTPAQHAAAAQVAIESAKAKGEFDPSKAPLSPRVDGSPPAAGGTGNIPPGAIQAATTAYADSRDFDPATALNYAGQGFTIQAGIARARQEWASQHTAGPGAAFLSRQLDFGREFPEGLSLGGGPASRGATLGQLVSESTADLLREDPLRPGMLAKPITLEQLRLHAGPDTGMARILGQSDEANEPGMPPQSIPGSLGIKAGQPITDAKQLATLIEQSARHGAIADELLRRMTQGTRASGFMPGGAGSAPAQPGETPRAVGARLAI